MYYYKVHYEDGSWGWLRSRRPVTNNRLISKKSVYMMRMSMWWYILQCIKHRKTCTTYMKQYLNGKVDYIEYKKYS